MFIFKKIKRYLSLQVVGVSSVEGLGITEFFEAIDAGAEEYERYFVGINLLQILIYNLRNPLRIILNKLSLVIYFLCK